jgi:pimeloyl-ACP methyl ester carboxylesterase
VILVGHDFGGACISYAMELFPSKISKAVFLAAAMLTNGQSTLDMFSLKVCFLIYILLMFQALFRAIVISITTHFAGRSERFNEKSSDIYLHKW